MSIQFPEKWRKWICGGVSAVLFAGMFFLVSCASGKEKEETRKIWEEPAVSSAVLAGDLAKVKKIVKSKIDACGITADKIPLTVLAAVSGQKEILSYLLSCGADINSCDARKNTALHVAAGKDHIEIVSLLLEKGALMDLPGNYGRTPLMEAGRCGSRKSFDLLLEKGADPGAKDELGRSVLMHVCQGGKDEPEMVKILLKKGVDAEEVDQSGKMALVYAAERAYTESAKLLLEKYEDFSKDIPIGLIAMKGAIRGSDVRLAGYLIEKNLPLNWDLFFSRQILRRLGVRGAYRLMAKNGILDAKRAPLLVAAKENNLLMVKFLLEKGADILQEDEKGYTAKDLATNREVINFLKKAENKKFRQIHKEKKGKKKPLFRGRILGN